MVDMQSNPRILVISSDKYPPFRVDVTVLFGKELTARGIVIDWLLQSENACDHQYEVPWGSGTVWVGRTDLGVSRLHRVRKHIHGMANDLRVMRLAKSHRYSIIQVKDKILAALPALWAARRSKSIFVYWLSFPHPEASLHLARVGEARYPVLYRIRGWVQFHLLYRFIMRHADHVFVQSEQMKRDIAGYGIPEEKMTAVPMGVDLATFETVVAARRAEDVNSKVIAYLGTLAGERRIDFLVRCLSEVLKREPTAHLLLVGAGGREGDEEEIMAEATRLGIADRVSITGFLPQKEALRLIAGAEVCVSPFYPTPILNSTSPTKLVEYMALGKAVVANDHPEQRLVLEQSGAGFCVPYDESAFAQAILKLLADRDLATAMGALGRSYVKLQRSYSVLAEFLEEKYLQILAASSYRRSA